MDNNYKVFISYKRTVDGEITKDAEIAKALYNALISAGYKTFFSEESLSVLGADRYKEMIDQVLDHCSVLVVVGTSVDNINSSWVKYEWDSFYSDILSDRKKGRMFSYVDRINPHDLPRTLRSLQSFDCSSTPINEVVLYVENAINSLDQKGESDNNTIVVKEEPENTVANSQDALLRFANLIDCGDTEDEYVNPYISDDMADITANFIGEITPYNAERCMKEGLNPVLFEVFLAQKIARINKPESCIKSFNLLHQVVNSWTVFLNEEKKIVSYWIFIALKENSYMKISLGKTEEKDISIEDVDFIDMPGHYYGYLLLSGTIKECRTPKVVNTLYSSWLDYVEKLAKEGIFFDEITSMVGSRAGNNSLKRIGMEPYADYIAGGTMYKYYFSKGIEYEYLRKHHTELAKLYDKEMK